jgi:tetratricopeptide (TPR) repeat protein
MGEVTAAERLDRTVNQNLKEPLTQEEVRDLIKKNKKDLDVVYKALDERGVNFDLDRKIEAKMRSAGADDNLLQAIWKAGPTSKNSKAATLTSSSGVPLHAKYEEAMGYKTMESELDPDKRLRMVEEFERRFPTSELMSTVYTQAAKSYREKGDLNRLVEYGEKSLELDANNLYSLLMVAIALPQPGMLENNPELSAQRLSTAKEYAMRTLKLIDGVPARPNETDQQLKKRKDALASDAHTALAVQAGNQETQAKSLKGCRNMLRSSAKGGKMLHRRSLDIPFVVDQRSRR